MMKWEEEVVLSIDDDEEVRICLRELPMADGVHASTGNQLWTSSVLLAQLVIERRELFRGRRVMEMGAGVGLCGIVAAQFARCTKITDGDEEVISNVTHNVQLNRSVWQAWDFEAPREVLPEVLNWDTVRSLPLEERVDVIFASDIIYGFWGEAVGRAMVNILAPGGTILLVASEDRRCGVAAFKEYVGGVGFRVAETKFVVSLGTYRLFECRERLPEDPAGHPELAEWSDPRSRVGTAPVAKEVKPSEQAGFAATQASKVRWRVVGGFQQGGIIVRQGDDGKNSAFKGRLAHGAVIEEVARSADHQRLQYLKESGKGPRTGWVSFASGRGGRLLVTIAAT